MLKKLFLKILNYYYRADYNIPLNEREVDTLLTKIANDSGLKDFPRYLAQCADSARNRYLYSKDEKHKVKILADATLLLGDKVGSIHKISAEIFNYQIA